MKWEKAGEWIDPDKTVITWELKGLKKRNKFEVSIEKDPDSDWDVWERWKIGRRDWEGEVNYSAKSKKKALAYARRIMRKSDLMSKAKLEEVV